MHPVLSWSAILSHYNTSLKYLQVYCIINLKHVHFRWLTLNAINKILRIKGIHVFFHQMNARVKPQRTQYNCRINAIPVSIDNDFISLINCESIFVGVIKTQQFIGLKRIGVTTPPCNLLTRDDESSVCVVLI